MKTLTILLALTLPLFADRTLTGGGTIGMAVTYTISAGVSFTITSDSALDTSIYSFLLIEVNP